MTAIVIPRDWEIPEREATPECIYFGGHLDRRGFVKTLAVAGVGAWSLASGCAWGSESGSAAKAGSVRSSSAARKAPPVPRVLAALKAPRNAKFALGRALTQEDVAARYNNFYEFTTDKERVAELSSDFSVQPWQIQIRGLVAKPRTYDVADLAKRMPLEERLYRHRCVEAWAMAVPWTGFPLAALVRLAEPSAAARYVRLVSFMRPAEAVGQRQQSWYPWPYFEALTLAEATHELAFMATGIYGHELPPQHGAPIRLVTPWKYGFKSIKSIVTIEFTAARPPTFWNVVAPAEYDFTANVDPAIPHPRWSQANERLIGTGETVPTQKYNGYGATVAALYGS